MPSADVFRVCDPDDSGKPSLFAAMVSPDAEEFSAADCCSSGEGAVSFADTDGLSFTDAGTLSLRGADDAVSL